MKYPDPYTGTLEELLQPETELESELLRQPELREGMRWGEPRYGHPEGKVLYHVREVLDNVDLLDIDPVLRKQLRLITIVHDSFKNLEDKSRPRDWSRHHAVLARQFLERFTKVEAVLKVTELHDEAYYAWRAIHLYDKAEAGWRRLQQLLDRLGDDLQLFYLFFKCDTQTGDKIQAPVRWFEESVPTLQLVSVRELLY